ncbi:hypothetical protein ACTA71_003267 [Dictyostelium dimigraforme]
MTLSDINCWPSITPVASTAGHHLLSLYQLLAIIYSLYQLFISHSRRIDPAASTAGHQSPPLHQLLAHQPLSLHQLLTSFTLTPSTDTSVTLASLTPGPIYSRCIYNSAHQPPP